MSTLQNINLIDSDKLQLETNVERAKERIDSLKEKHAKEIKEAYEAYERALEIRDCNHMHDPTKTELTCYAQVPSVTCVHCKETWY